MHHILDKVEACKKKSQLQVSDFFDPFTINTASSILQGIQEIKFLTWGGYQGAERKKLYIFPEYLEIDKREFQISLICFQGSFKFFENSHRHVLGALLASGIKRDKLGDIFVNENLVQVLADSKVTGYLISNMRSIGPVPVVGEEKRIESLMLPRESLKEIRATVTSMRLDAVLSAGFFLSRSKSAELVKKDRVKVNWQPMTRVDYQINEGDILSVQGKGRIIVMEVLGTTKKDRIALKIGAYV
ncbi:RNA-binding protein [Desulfitibacter alkalitolerans]|uniref:YlmH family RNA-binding protein n=1 Tax=Desulfitibacter alkalitolerans TaxID=264641 RepID=UPI0012EBC219|nr:YlmH/Sll1252 family protein [Desulfitibacter alkalitolerans]